MFFTTVNSDEISKKPKKTAKKSGFMQSSVFHFFVLQKKALPRGRVGGGVKLNVKVNGRTYGERRFSKKKLFFKTQTSEN